MVNSNKFAPVDKLDMLTDTQEEALALAGMYHEEIAAGLLTLPRRWSKTTVFDDVRACVLGAIITAARSIAPWESGWWETVTDRAVALADNQGTPTELITEWLAKAREAAPPSLKAASRYLVTLRTQAVARLIAPEADQVLAPSEMAKLVATLTDTATSSVRTLADQMATFANEMKQYEGKELLGLRSGVAEIDRRLCGLRGFTIFGGRGGGGKTAKAMEIAYGVAERAEENDACVVVISADMPARTLYHRLLCRRTKMTIKSLLRGDLVAGTDHDYAHTPKQKKKIAEARKALSKVANDFVIADLEGQPITAASLIAIVRRALQRTGRKNCLLVVDYLQLLEAPEGASDTAADKHRIEEIQKVMRQTGAVVLAISEVRKPTAERRDWGFGIEELMGSSRLGYACDAALLMREMPTHHLRGYYAGLLDVESTTAAARENEIRQKEATKKETLVASGSVPVELSLVKGRDGMMRGSWAEEFDFWHYNFSRLIPGAHVIPNVADG